MYMPIARSSEANDLEKQKEHDSELHRAELRGVQYRQPRCPLEMAILMISGV